MPRKPSYGPRYVVPTYLVQVRGEPGCTMTGSPASAAAQVHCYRSNRPATAIVDVTYSEQCAHCGGNGRVAGKRRLSWQPCKRCKGRPNLHTEGFGKDDVSDMMRRNQSAWLAP